MTTQQAESVIREIAELAPSFFADVLPDPPQSPAARKMTQKPTVPDTLRSDVSASVSGVVQRHTSRGSTQSHERATAVSHLLLGGPICQAAFIVFLSFSFVCRLVFHVFCVFHFLVYFKFLFDISGFVSRYFKFLGISERVFSCVL